LPQYDYTYTGPYLHAQVKAIQHLGTTFTILIKKYGKQEKKKEKKTGKIGTLKKTFTKEGKIGQDGTGGNINLQGGKRKQQ
jgi:hypothetical protein